jgi:hypothetical protein
VPRAPPAPWGRGRPAARLSRTPWGYEGIGVRGSVGAGPGPPRVIDRRDGVPRATSEGRSRALGGARAARTRVLRWQRSEGPIGGSSGGFGRDRDAAGRRPIAGRCAQVCRACLREFLQSNAAPIGKSFYARRGPPRCKTPAAEAGGSQARCRYARVPRVSRARPACARYPTTPNQCFSPRAAHTAAGTAQPRRPAAAAPPLSWFDHRRHFRGPKRPSPLPFAPIARKPAP